MEALHRHDIVDWSCVNKEVRLFNRHLAKRLKCYKHVTISSVDLDRQHFTKHGLHLNNRGNEKVCQRIVELVQGKLGSVVDVTSVNAIPLRYGKDIVLEEVVCNQGNELEKSVLDLSLNYMVLSESDQRQEVRMSTRVRRPPVKFSKDFL
jgi:hypothetical protein